MKQWTKNYMKSITEIEAQGTILPPDEQVFIKALKKQIEKEIAVSRKQAADLDEIWQRVVA